MAGLPPDGEWLIQQESGIVTLFHRHTEEEIVRFNPGDLEELNQAMSELGHNDRFNLEQKMYFALWAGYFYAHATR